MTRLLALGMTVSVTFFGACTIAGAESYNSVCAVFKGERLIERNLCNQRWTARISNGDESNIREFRWKSGGKTVTSNIEEWFKINGKEGVTEFTKDGYELCVKNLSSGNTFCTASR